MAENLAQRPEGTEDFIVSMTREMELIFPELGYLHLSQKQLRKKDEFEFNEQALEKSLKIGKLLEQLINPEYLRQSLFELSSISVEELRHRKISATKEFAKILCSNKDRLADGLFKREEYALTTRGEETYSRDRSTYISRFTNLEELEKDFDDGKYTISISFIDYRSEPMSFHDVGPGVAKEYDVVENNPNILFHQEKDEGYHYGFLYLDEYVKVKEELSSETQHIISLLVVEAFVEYLTYLKSEAAEEEVELEEVEATRKERKDMLEILQKKQTIIGGILSRVASPDAIAELQKRTEKWL